MKIFLTNGTGFLGSSLVEALLAQEQVEQVVVFDRTNLNSGFFTNLNLANPKLKFVEGDILDRRKVKKELKGCEVLVHLGLDKNLPHTPEDTHRLEMINHWGTAELIDLAEDVGVKKFILASSSTVYGQTTPGKPAKEEHDLIAQDALSQSIIRAEKHAFRFLGNQKIEMFIFRLAELFGSSPNTDFSHSINKWLLQSKLINKITLFGEGNHVNSYLSITQATEVFAKTILHKQPEGIFNLSDVQTSLLDLLDVLKELNPDLEFVFVNHHLEMPSLEISSSLAQETFKLKNIDLKTELKSFWDRLGKS